MTKDKNKPVEIEFAPGCFDDFEGSQEELDELVQQIQNMFAGKTREELELESHELTEDDWDELPDEVKDKLAQRFEDAINEDRTRKLQ